MSCTVDELRERLGEIGSLGSDYALINGLVTRFDIDVDDFARLCTFKCKRCEMVLNKETRTCPNKNCKGKFSSSSLAYTVSLDLLIDITDSTGTLKSIKMSTNVFERVLATTIDECLRSSGDELVQLKWRVLMERWNALIKINCQSSDGGDEDADAAYIKYFFKLVDLESPFKSLFSQESEP